MDLSNIVKRLEEYASLKTACYSKLCNATLYYLNENLGFRVLWPSIFISLVWDNVGLLVEPSGKLLVERVLITNDLTEPVFGEALSKNVNFIISYHPVIFEPLKRLTQSEWLQRSIVKCIENRIAVYSPHTTWVNSAHNWNAQKLFKIIFLD